MIIPMETAVNISKIVANDNCMHKRIIIFKLYTVQLTLKFL